MKKLFLMVVLGLFAALGMPSMALANTCAPAVTQGTAPADYKDYCWLDFSGYNDTTALAPGGQSFNFTLPDLSTLSMTLNTTAVVSTGSPQLLTKAVPSWTGSAFGNTAFLNIPGQTILYSGANGSTVKVTMSNITVSPPAGGTGIAKYAIIVGDGESTDGSETLTFTTNGDNWTQLSKIANGTSTNYPTVTGLGTKTVLESGGGLPSPTGAYVFGSFNNPTQISAQFKGSGLQGFIVGVRYASISVVSQINNVRYNAPDQFTYSVKTTSGVTMTSAATSGTALNGFAAASLPTVAASYPFVVDEVMVSSSTGTLANYTVSLSCTNTNTGSTTVLPTNTSVSSYTIASLQYGDAVHCTFTNTPIFSPVTGTVYNDANHNASQDGTESGTAVSGLYVKLAPSSGGVCQTPASASAVVNTTTGAYSLPAVSPGNYCLILDNNATLSDIVSNPPPGWLGTQNASGVIQLSVDSFPPETPQNFGLYNGSKLSGTVFADTGSGAGTANNGVKDGSEAGMASVTVKATAGASTITSATAGDGTYTLWIPANATGSLVITPTAPSGYFATGGSAGTTSSASGSYTRPSVTYTAPATTGQTYTSVNFGLVPPNTLAPNGAQTAQPGTVVFYAHTFYAGSGGLVTFSLASTPTPTSLTWNQVLYQDVGCTGTLASTSPLITGPLTFTVGQTVCLVVKQFVPASAALGAQNVTTLSALFSYTGAAPVLSNTLTAMDVTTVDEPSALALTKRVANLTQGGAVGLTVNAKPGETLQYTLTAINNGNESLSTLVINDATPAFTTFFSAACPGSFSAGITACSLSQQPVVGAIGNVQWTFTGTLAPSAQLVVTYQVKVNN
ncbi:hypothetical protein BH10PSE16_BH10PSE16_26660 [soil metagenome]